MKDRARSSTANAAWPSLRWQTSGVQAQGAQQTPSADAEHALLLQPHSAFAAVEFACDAAVRRRIRGVVGIEQVELSYALPALPTPESRP